MLSGNCPYRDLFRLAVQRLVPVHPRAGGEHGNIAAEDCTYLLESLGMNTGIDIPALLELHGQLEVWLAGEQFEGRLFRAGMAKIFADRAGYPAVWPTYLIALSRSANSRRLIASISSANG